MSRQMFKVEEMIDSLEDCGESAGVAVGNDLRSVIESAQYDKMRSRDILDLVEGELENMAEKVAWALGEVRRVRGKL